MRKVLASTLLVFSLAQISRAANPPPEQALTKMRPQLTNNIARPLCYFPINGDFVITNGAEFFNRPLYCDNSAFRIDGGDKPEFSLYLPGRGGNLRLGIKTGAGTKWLNDADQIVTRYRAGELIYEIHDKLLGDGELDLTAIPLSDTKGIVFRAQLFHSQSSIPNPRLIFGFGGANGMRGKRGGDIGCESEPVSEFFQLRPEECRGNEFEIVSNRFILHSKPATIAGTFPANSELHIADAMKWNSPGEFFSEGKASLEFPVAADEVELQDDQSVYFSLQIAGTETFSTADLPKLFSVAEIHRREIADRVSVETPDAFINAEVPALNIAADAIWDAQQKSFMHGAVAWRVRLLGWRGPYAGDALGWHARTAEHFISFALEQNTNPIPDNIPPADENSNLARSETALHSNGDLTKSHYDMNLVAVDAFFRHLLWTGDLNFARTNWPVIERHLAWERRLFRREFGPDHLPLYEAYAAIWASDDLNYNGGGTAHASAYNYFANKMAARVAKLIGKDPAPYEREADLILRGMNKYLWLTNENNFAEFKDYLGLQLAHPNAGLWTFYNTIDSEVPSPEQAWQMSDWIDNNIARIPILISGSSERAFAHFEKDQSQSRLTSAATNYFILPETSWMPYQWSLNNVVMAENAHTALGFWQANRPKTAFELFKGELLESGFLGLCPGNFGAMTSHDAARGEAQRDFGDAIGINSRALVEGLFGVKPDALAGELKIVPGFPADWKFAKIHHPDFDFEFQREDVSETYSIESKFPKPMKLDLEIPAFSDWVGGVYVNDAPAKFELMKGIFGVPRIQIKCPAAAKWEVRIEWKGNPPAKQITPEVAMVAKEKSISAFDWNKKLSAKFETINLAPFFNDSVTQIFKNDYRSPRSPFCSLAIPKQGIGGWCEPNASFNVDDSGLRKVAAEHSGEIVLPDGIPFSTPTNLDSENIVFTSQWNNYPDEVSVPLTGKSSDAFLLMAGSTGPMESRFDNGEVIVTYTDGSTDKLILRNPETWWPIDQDYFTDDFAFRLDAPLPPRVDLATGRIRILDPKQFEGKGGTARGGAATVLDLPLDKSEELKSLTVRALANEVVIGLMSVTLERE
ncbi:MAG TPA: DUF4450 domain-containing protein [Verrucomicrobiae bacterium]|nr:DUF4450 domain-containing protein [Verrucomicrobiae bacterium]